MTSGLRLAYKDRFVSSLTQDIEGAPSGAPSPFVFQDGLNYVLLELTEQDFTDIFSALLTGADLMYGDNANTVIWKFLKAFEYPMNICQLIADCLNDPESPAYDALRDAIEQGGQSNPNAPVFGGESLGQQDRTLGGDCDLDTLFGFVTQIVDLIHTSILDVFELVEVGSNSFERADILTDNVPFLSEAVDHLDQILEELQEGYSGAYSETLRNQFRCDLFCLAQTKPDCILKFSDIANYFLGLNGGTLVNVNFGDAVSNLFGIYPLAGNEIVYASSGLLCLVVAYGSEWLGLDVGGLQRIVQSYLNDPDSDWTTLCDECPEECLDGLPVNFLETLDCWEVISGSWEDNGQGVVGTLNGSGQGILEIYKNFTGFQQTNFSVTWGNATGTQGFFSSLDATYDDNTTAHIINNNGGINTGGGLTTTNGTNPHPEKTIVKLTVGMVGGSGGSSTFRVTAIS